MALTKGLGIAILVLGGVLVVAEIHTLTIYLLAEAVACFASGAVAIAGGGLDAALITFAAVTLLGLPAAHWIRHKLRNREADEVTQDDAGRTATILSAEADSMRVTYRGTVWEARLETPTGGPPLPGDTLRISAREGNVLVLAGPVTEAGQSDG